MNSLVGIIMGSRSDWDTMKHAADTLERLGVPHDVQVVSAHRTPDLLFEYAETAVARGLEVIIAGAGGAAHLPGMAAAKTRLPVLGVPVKSTHTQRAWIRCCRSCRCLRAFRSARSPSARPAPSTPPCSPLRSSLSRMPTIASALERYRREQTERVLADADPRI